MEQTRPDVIVVGAGLAGLVAARDLEQAGFEVLILEARDRIGGRVLSARFPGTDHIVDLGGAWFSPDAMPPIAAEIERYRLSVVAEQAPDRAIWRTDGEIRTGFPVPLHEGFELERAIVGLQNVAASFLQGTSADLLALDVSIEHWLDALALPRATRDLVEGMLAVYAGAPGKDVSVLSIAAALAPFGGSIYALFAGLSHKLENGATRLVDAIRTSFHGTVRLNAPVAGIEQGTDEVRVRLVSGELLSADHAIVAVPLNTLTRIQFSPRLPIAISAIAESGHPCHCAKVIAAVDGVPRRFMASGDADLQWAMGYGEAEGSTLVTAFATRPTPAATWADEHEVTRALRAFFPAATARAVVTHDWSTDPWSQGAWVSARPGWRGGIALSEFQQPHGRIRFAGSDVAGAFAGWMAGAVCSGIEAAAAIDRQYAAAVSDRAAT